MVGRASALRRGESPYNTAKRHCVTQTSFCDRDRNTVTGIGRFRLRCSDGGGEFTFQGLG